MGSQIDLSKLDNSRSLLIWIDLEMDIEKYKKYKKLIKSEINLKIIGFNTVCEAIDSLKQIRFIKTFIVCDENCYSKFIKQFKKDLNEFMICPKIVLFSDENTNYSNKKKHKLKSSFFNLGGIKKNLSEIISFLKQNDLSIEKQLNGGIICQGSIQYNFEQISDINQLILPIYISYYTDNPKEKEIERFNKYIIQRYSNEKDLVYLFEQLLNLKEVPSEIISKFWARAYTAESKFYREMNEDLRYDYMNKYIIFIQMMYYGIKIKSFTFKPNSKLYRGAFFEPQEMSELQEYMAKKQKDLPGAIVYSRSFLSFSLNEETALKFKKNVLLIIEDYKEKNSINCSGCASITKFSFFANEEEVLVFPFSSFEIKSIIRKYEDSGSYFIIYLDYLGKYEALFNNQNPIDLISNIPEDSKLAKAFFKTMLPCGNYTEHYNFEMIRKRIEREKKEEERKRKEEEMRRKEEEGKRKEAEEKFLKSFFNEFIIEYKLKDNNNNYYTNIKLFGTNFIENNKKNCLIFLDGNRSEIFENYNINEKVKIQGSLKIILKTNDKITNMSYLFKGCEALVSFKNMTYFEINNITDMSQMFSGCSSLKILPDFSYWNTTKVTNFHALFYECKSLLYLPDISKWNIYNATDISHLFASCEQLKSLPDISKWQTNNIESMRCLFYCCMNLKSLPDISNWVISKVTNIKSLFAFCYELISLPDISKWDTRNITNMNSLFCHCSSLSYFPDISKWNTSKVTDMECMFYLCQIYSLPDISIWDTRNVITMSAMFSQCSKLRYLPKIERWDTRNVQNMHAMFVGCNFSLKIPDKFPNQFEPYCYIVV